jgi:hypothetical protein
VLPSVFAVVIGRRSYYSPSIYPSDPDSIHFDPHAYDPVDEKVTPHAVENVPAHGHALNHGEVVHVEQVTSRSHLDQSGHAFGGGPGSNNAANDPQELPPFPGDL